MEMRRLAGALIILIAFVSYRVFDRVTSGHTPVQMVDRESEHAGRMPRGTSFRSPAPPPKFLRNPLHFLSTAPVDSLCLLPGIGPVIAERVAVARDGQRLFTDWDELLEIKGLGQKKVAALRKLADGQF